jgi:ankyrin repeat protein
MAKQKEKESGMTRIMVRSVALAVFSLVFVFSARAEEIHDAIKKGDLEKVKQIIEQDPSAANLATKPGRTSLMVAVDVGNKEIVEYLLTHGADPNPTPSKLWAPPLHLAARGKTPDLCQLLIDNGAQVDLEDATGLTALYYVTVKEVGEYLISKGADVNHIAAKTMGMTPLLWAASSTGDNAVLAQLVLDNGADINAKDSLGQTAMLQAVSQGNLKVIMVLRDHKKKNKGN